MDALIKITEKIQESIDKGKYGCGIFIDLRKAFDTVNHDILLLKSYIYERKHYVHINGECLELKLISWCSSGVCSWSFVILNLHKRFA